MEEKLFVNKIEYSIKKLLGHGKGGYSYLAERCGNFFVIKQIHHEPCDYYTFGNKIEAEKNDYLRLIDAGITVPKMIDIDIQNERILKEYIDGYTVDELIKNGEPIESCFEQILEMAKKAKSAGLNIDYYPTNFVLQGKTLYYIDYECNEYKEEWDFEHWGINYWKTSGENK